MLGVLTFVSDSEMVRQLNGPNDGKSSESTRISNCIPRRMSIQSQLLLYCNAAASSSCSPDAAVITTTAEVAKLSSAMIVQVQSNLTSAANVPDTLKQWMLPQPTSSTPRASAHEIGESPERPVVFLETCGIATQWAFYLVRGDSSVSQ